MNSRLKNELKSILACWRVHAEQHDIHWTLAAGSVLGAIRHGEMIPWDDDIDLYIRNADVKKLVESVQTMHDMTLLEPFTFRNPNPFFKLIANKTYGWNEYDNSWEPLAVDIFPLVNEGIFTRAFPLLIRRLLNIPRKFLKWQKHIPNKAIALSFIIAKYLFYKLVNSKGEGRSLRNIFGAHVKKETLSQAEFTNSELFSFEGMTVKIPGNAHAYLERLYGNYKELPPPEAQIAHYQNFINIDDVDLTICVSTLDGLPKDFEFLDESDGVRYLILNQGKPMSSPKLNHVRVKNISTLGLSKSRNEIFEELEAGSFCVIADNDVRHKSNIKSVLFPYLLNFSIVTFNNIDMSGPRLKTAIHGKLSVMKVPSWAISFCHDKMPKFDENFGIGTQFNNGEENIFLLDAVRGGVKGLHIADALVEHKGISTGYIFDEQFFKTKGAMIRRMFGLRGVLFVPIFFLRKMKYSKISKFHALHLMLRTFFKA